MRTILDEIVAYKKEFVRRAKRGRPPEALRAKAKELPQTRDFARALVQPGTVAIIAEVKHASPSKGVIREDFDPARIARTYQEHGAAAISALTDEHYFQGSAAHLTQVRQAVDLPLLRKDFVVDAYQIYEARALGADAVLLIAAILGRDQINVYLEVAHQLGLAALVEVHTHEELATVLGTDAPIIGINNRDLATFTTDLATTYRLAPLIPKDRIVVSESGIHHRGDLEQLCKIGVNAVLIGEALLRKEDIGGALSALRGLTCC